MHVEPPLRRLSTMGCSSPPRIVHATACGSPPSLIFMSVTPSSRSLSHHKTHGEKLPLEAFQESINPCHCWPIGGCLTAGFISIFLSSFHLLVLYYVWLCIFFYRCWSRGRSRAAWDVAGALPQLVGYLAGCRKYLSSSPIFSIGHRFSVCFSLLFLHKTHLSLSVICVNSI